MTKRTIKSPAKRGTIDPVLAKQVAGKVIRKRIVKGVE